jgi:lipid II:glycine glycyltransferase (peptidoglycan interpeptide bridge formation enzyme)
MPTVNIDENIKKVTQTIEQMTQEIFRLQGMLQTFRDLKKGGLETIELPRDPTQASDEELEKIEDESTHEKPE